MIMTEVGDIWDAIEDTPQEAANMRLRAILMMALKEHLVQKGWTQNEAALQLGVSQPRISDLSRGKINAFGLDTLVNMAVSAGLKVDIAIAA